MATGDIISVYQGNTLTVTCTVTGLSSLSGYTGYFTVKDRDGGEEFESTGSIDGLVITFTITKANNTRSAYDYLYEITINDGTNYFTLKQGVYRVMESIKY